MTKLDWCELWLSLVVLHYAVWLGYQETVQLQNLKGQVFRSTVYFWRPNGKFWSQFAFTV